MHFLQTKSIVRNLNTDFILNDWLFGSVKLTKNVNPDKYLSEGPTQGLNDTTLTAEDKFSQPRKRLNYVYTIMELIVSYLLMLQRYISSKQKPLK